MNYTIKLIFAGIFLMAVLIPLSALAKPSPQSSASARKTFTCAQIQRNGDIVTFACDADGNPVKIPKPEEDLKYTGWILDNLILILLVVAVLVDLVKYILHLVDCYFPEEEGWENEARFRAEEQREEDGEPGW